ncbi:alpha/beta hydrolase [Chryseomicrobium sp. FSL W7-1435]|uniref:alpha/beta fold hydrolase n=1 Tax=Chryseomicrobium sp. FSL W7-1435 TaxID=2921704 RepID=UPI00315AF7FC
MFTATINDIQLTFTEKGSGTPVLLLHGLTGNRHMFDEETKVLKKYLRVIVPDLRGHGDSERPSSYTLEDIIEDCYALIEELEIPSLHIIGVSMGSYVAQGLAIRLGDRVNRLVLVATKSAGTTSSMQALFDAHEEELQGLSHNAKLLKASKYMYHDLQAVGQWSKGAAKKAEAMTAEQIEAANSALMGFDFTNQLSSISAKTLVISGDHDQLNPSEEGRETARLIPHATFAEFNQSGHAPNVEQRLLYLDFVLEFLGIERTA